MMSACLIVVFDLVLNAGLLHQFKDDQSLTASTEMRIEFQDLRVFFVRHGSKRVWIIRESIRKMGIQRRRRRFALCNRLQLNLL